MAASRSLSMTCYLFLHQFFDHFCQLKITQYLFVREDTFLANPASALNIAINVTTDEIQKLLKGLNFVQRMILPQTKDSLFVPAFCVETLASFNGDYYE